MMVTNTSIRNRWKRRERDVAELFDSVRTPLSGLNSRHNTGSDTLHKQYYIEIKEGKTRNWILKYLLNKMLKGFYFCTLREAISYLKNHDPITLNGVILNIRKDLQAWITEAETNAIKERKEWILIVICPLRKRLQDCPTLLKRVVLPVASNTS